MMKYDHDAAGSFSAENAGRREAARRIALTALAALLALLSACGPEADRKSRAAELELRARADNLNKAAFVDRYRDSRQAVGKARAALALLNDSLPQYADGRLRACNNLAFGFYMLAEHDSASAYIDSVLCAPPQLLRHARNAGVEQTIAKLLRIRLLQRSCNIAESYAMLYDISSGGTLKRLRRHKGDGYLNDYALMEYYITSLTLNYHYRNGAVASSSGTTLTASTRQFMAELLQEVEEVRPELRCDYAEDQALNYAIAHACYRLSAVSGADAGWLRKAFDYLDLNRQILSTPRGHCGYHAANVHQLTAFIGADPVIAQSAGRLRAACPELPADPAEVLELFRQSTDMFFATSDPYQHLGAAVAAAEYALDAGSTEEAHAYYAMALADSSWHDGMAPKFESMLYDGLIRSGYALSEEEGKRWYEREMELLDYIRQSERADVLLQEGLLRAESLNRYYRAATLAAALLCVLLAVLVALLRRRSRVLRQETLALQESKRQDVERIANVETCLSVLRHDITPFLSYLTNKKLPDEMRQEVLEQLLRTFANIKNWTNLSIPSGLQFQLSQFPLDEVFARVQSSCVRLHEEVELRFEPCGLMLSGDCQLAEILLRNLVNNALQHTEHGSVTVRAELFADDSRFAHLTVQDSGCGMDEATLDGLFRADKPMAADPAPGAPHGTGFGLILCKYIIKRHDDNTLRGCRIWAESQPGKGSTFHCLLELV